MSAVVDSCTCATLPLADFEPDVNRPDPEGCGVFRSSCSSVRPVVLAREGPHLNSRSTPLNGGRGRARSLATLLAGRDRGPGRQEPLGSAVVESCNGIAISGYQCGSINARTINDYLRTIIKETKRSLSPVDDTRVFEGIQRGPERNNEGSKEACLNTVRKELRQKIETC